MDTHDSHMPAWTVPACVFLAASIAMTVQGTWCFPLGLREYGCMGIAALFLVHASISLTKTLRDRQEARILTGRGR